MPSQTLQLPPASPGSRRSQSLSALHSKASKVKGNAEGSRSIWQREQTYGGQWTWHTYGHVASDKFEKALTAGDTTCKIWDGPYLREVDIENMCTLPGLGRIRRVCLADETARQKALKEGCRPTTTIPAPGRTPSKNAAAMAQDCDGSSSSGSSGSGRSGVSSSGSSALAMELRKIQHPDIAALREPRFQIADKELAPLPAIPKLGSARPESRPADCADLVMSLADDYVAQLQARTGAVLTMKGTPNQMMAALSIALYRLGGTKKLGIDAITFFMCIDASRARSQCHALLGVWREWQDRAAAPSLPVSPMASAHLCTEKSAGRLARLGCVAAALKRIVNDKALSQLVDRTQVLSWSQVKQECKLARGRHGQQKQPCRITLAQKRRGSALEVAFHETQSGRRAIVAVTVSQQTVGGELLSGGQHGPEEELCMRSGLFPALQKAADNAAVNELVDSSSHRVYIPEDGVLVSPDVQVEAYSPCSPPVQLAGLICYSVPDTGDDAASMAKRNPTRLQHQFEVMLHAASELQAQTLVISRPGGAGGEADCGIPPDVFGRFLGETLASYHGTVEEVILVGCSTQLQEAVLQANRSIKKLPHLR